MASVTVRVLGMSAVLENINITNSQLTKKIDAAIQNAGISCQAYAKQSCPVDTGRLRNSILYQNTGQFSCNVNTTVVYAPFIEWGTRHMAARPFLYPAYALASAELLDALRSI